MREREKNAKGHNSHVTRPRSEKAPKIITKQIVRKNVLNYSSNYNSETNMINTVHSETCMCFHWIRFNFIKKASETAKKDF